MTWGFKSKCRLKSELGVYRRDWARDHLCTYIRYLSTFIENSCMSHPFTQTVSQAPDPF